MHSSIKPTSRLDLSLFGGADGPDPLQDDLPTTPGSVTLVAPTLWSSSASSSSDGESESDSTGPLRQRRPRARSRSRAGDEPATVDAAATATAGKKDDDDDDDQAAVAHRELYGTDRTDFLWSMTEEPHRSRRLAILRAHPEIKRLMGHTRTTKYLVAFVVALQLGLAVGLTRLGLHPLSAPFLAIAYLVGGTANQNLFLAIHEISHNMAFRGVVRNRLLAMGANLAIGVPYSVVFKKYHLEHHKRMGEDGVDTDIPCKLEALLLNNVAGKTFFAIFQIFFYALRPSFVRSAGAFTRWHALNFAVVLGLDALLTRTFGWGPVLYLLFSSFFAGSLHPLAGHFIAEHYAFKEGSTQETYSYYGPLNLLAYNVGYHNEHHDFPNVPWTRLPEITRLAPEWYDEHHAGLKAHTSWPGVTWRFITDPEVGMFSRVKRDNVRGD